MSVMVTEIERALLSRYYPAGSGTAGMSSHWRDYAGQFEVSVDHRGSLVAVGFGFGACRWQGLLHRFFDTLARALHLTHLRHRGRVTGMYRKVSAVVARMGLDPTLDVFRQACTAELLERVVARATPPNRILLIGDGYGVLGALLKTLFPAARIVFVDLGRTLLFQAHHVGRAFPFARHALVDDGADDWRETDFVYCPSDRVAAFEGLKVDLAINVASMQEMTPDAVRGYFSLLRRALPPAGLFYCCNRERKVMPGGEVSEFASYPWDARDRVLLDERCPWHQYFLAARGYTRVKGLPVPFLRRYDGPHRHRLAVLHGPEDRTA